jgi:hypothetical protein
MYVSRDDFLKALTISEEDFDVAGLGTVRIKPLSLADRAAVQKANTGKDGQLDVLEMQTAALITGLVEPKLTIDDVAALRAGRPGVIDAITLRVLETSGMESSDAFEKKVGSGS